MRQNRRKSESIISLGEAFAMLGLIPVVLIAGGTIWAVISHILWGGL